MGTSFGHDGRCSQCGEVALTGAGCTRCRPATTAVPDVPIRYVYEMTPGSDERVRAILTALAGEFQATIRHHENRGRGGQQVTFTGDFASVGPGTLSRMRWWLREMQAALGESVDP